MVVVPVSSALVAAEDRGAIFSGCLQSRLRQRWVVDRRFVRAKHRGFHFWTKCRLQFTGVFGTNRLGPQSPSMMDRDVRAQLARAVPRKKRLHSSLGTKTNVLAGNFFNARNEFRIERHAGLAK